MLPFSHFSVPIFFKVSSVLATDTVGNVWMQHSEIMIILAYNREVPLS